MYLSRLSLRERAYRDPSFWRTFRDEYQWHRAVWSMFDRQNSQRAFLYRVDSEGRGTRLWTLSEHAPKPPGDLWRLESKLFAPQIEAGDVLAFDLRVNPIVTRNGKRHDVVMNLKKTTGRNFKPPEERQPEQALVQQALETWTARRADRLGVTFRHLRADGHMTRRFPSPKLRKLDKPKRMIHLSTCELTGTLEVDDPDRFLEAWRNGIGPAKGFGCGMMLIRRERG